MTTPTEAYEQALDPRRWTQEMHDAWHKALPDTQAAFAALRACIKPPAQQPEQPGQFTLLNVLADIRQKTGIGDKPMLSEIADVLAGMVRYPDCGTVVVETSDINTRVVLRSTFSRDTVQITYTQPTQGAEVELGTIQYLVEHSIPDVLLRLAQIEAESDGETIEMDSEIIADIANTLESAKGQLIALRRPFKAALSHPLTPAEREEAVRVMQQTYSAEMGVEEPNYFGMEAALSALEAKGYVGRKG